MEKKKELRIKIQPGRPWKELNEPDHEGEAVAVEPLAKGPSFECLVFHNLDLKIDKFWLNVEIPIVASGAVPPSKKPPRMQVGIIIPVSEDCSLDELDTYSLVEQTQPIAVALSAYSLEWETCKDIETFFSRREHSKACEYLGKVRERALRKAGYEVTVEIPQTRAAYFPSPTSIAYVGPPFGLGIKKGIKPIHSAEDYHTIHIYFSQEKPQHKTEIQLELLEDLPEDELKEIERELKDCLSPYGLKVLYLVIHECARNNRSPWFILDINKSLDLLRYKKKVDGGHHLNNRRRLLQALYGLTHIKFNIERREPKYGNKDAVFKVKTPMLSITGAFEEWEVERGRPVEKGRQIENGVQIFIHPEIYKYIDSLYTFLPSGFLTIDAGKKPYAILLYPYIANQFRIGLHQYRGIIKQPLRQILDGAGLLNGLPKRKNQQRDYIERIKNDLEWLTDQKEFWIRSIQFEQSNGSSLDQTVTINMAEDHPLKIRMTKQLEQPK
jgi:hypothetical protein